MGNMKSKRTIIFNTVLGLFLLGTAPSSLFSQTISEKKANLQSSQSDLDEETERFLIQINRETLEIHEQLQHLYDEVLRLYQTHAPEEEYRALLEQINNKKRYLNRLEQTWRELVTKGNRSEGYGLWHAPETTLEQLIIDYGSQDFVYLIPPEVGGIKLSINSNLPIPRSSWSDLLQLILTQNGVGVHSLNPYLRQLYLLKQTNSHLKLITNHRHDLEVLPPESRVTFVLSPEPSEVRRTYTFLEKFINPNTTSLQFMGRDILVIGSAGEIQDLLRLNDFVAHNRGEKEYRLLPIYKLPVEEMARILEVTFDQSEEISSPSPSHSNGVGSKGRASASAPPTSVGGLKIIPLENMAQALFVVGTREEVRKAEEIIRNVENQIGGARDKVVHWYTVKHSEAEELADVLYKVYSLMINTGTGSDGPSDGPDNVQNKVVVVDNNLSGDPFGGSGSSSQKEPPPSLYGEEGFYQEGGYVVNPAPAQPRAFEPTVANNNRDNFIVDVKTGAIVMVVEADVLPKIKDLLRKLDVPKKMVQIETLLFEKILNRENSVGLNLLKIGDAAMNKNLTGAFFNNLFPKHNGKPVAANAGVTEFFMSRKGSDCGIPAFDLVYRFLLNQDDVQINSSPSLLTVNQTPATIAINEDISINTGIFEVETAKGVTLKDAFTRAQYGITISIKPTIHMSDIHENESDFDYVTLETDVTFDTINPSRHADRPDVTRRHITNQVQVPDGETVILGGLRRKVSNDRRESIPFIGELPGLGKLFSINTMRDTNTEMFIFITPHIVKDPKEQLTCLRQQLLCLRPGDIPYFLECVQEAHQYEKTRLMEGSMTLLFGRPREHYFITDQCPTRCANECMGEYDGR
ncbi:MAG: type II secretion system protein GspD [Parachlamydiaceae bacterium]